MQMTGLAVIASLALSSLWTANDPFVGRWKLDVSRSTIVDQMVVEAAGPNRYAFRFEGGPAETIVADGTDQPGQPGTTLAIRAEGPRSLTVVRKQDGRVTVSAQWKVSEDGRTLRDTFASLQPDGSTATTHYVYQRTSAGSGFVGGWESTTQPVGLKLELQIQPDGDKGLSFASQGAVRHVIFDGAEHAVPGDTQGLTRSGRRRSERALDYTESIAGKLSRSRALALSRGGATLTMTVRVAGQTTPDVFVFDRA